MPTPPALPTCAPLALDLARPYLRALLEVDALENAPADLTGALTALGLLDATPEGPALERCATHGTQPVLASHYWTGFAGGACSADTLECGCTIADESADLRAAE